MNTLVILSHLRSRGIKRLPDIVRKVLTQERQLDVPLFKRLKAWRTGFKSSSYIQYELDKHDHTAYLSDSAPYIAEIVEGAFSRVLKDKFLFTLLMRAFVDVPDVVGIVSKGRITPLHPDSTVRDVQSLLRYCEDGHGVFPRPCEKSRGGFTAIEASNPPDRSSQERAPLLRDARSHGFFEYHEVINWMPAGLTTEPGVPHKGAFVPMTAKDVA